MVVSFWKNIFIGTCGIMLIVTLVLINADLLYRDNKSIVSWIQRIRNSSVFKKDNLPAVNKDNLPVLKKDNLPASKKENLSTLKKDNSSNSKKDNLPASKKEKLSTLKKDNSSNSKKDNSSDIRKDNPPVLKKVNSSVLKRDSDLTLPPGCLLPLQWTLETNSSNTSKLWTVIHWNENNTCLGLLIKKHCYKDKRIVPNVVHYVMFGKNPLQIYTFLSFLGTWKYIKPCFIVIHGDFPFGPLLEKFLTYKPRIIHIKMTPKETIFGKKLSWIQHKADVARLEVILKYGGIYMDYDEIPLKSFDSLRNHSVVLGQETGNQLGNGVIVAEPSTTFVKIWMAAYRSYNPSQWAFHSTMVPFQLAQLLPNMVFITPTFFKPNYNQLDQLYGKNIDWSNFYGIHLYGKTRIKSDTLETIRYEDNTYGSVARFVYYNNKTLQKKNERSQKETIKKSTTPIKMTTTLIKMATTRPKQ